MGVAVRAEADETSALYATLLSQRCIASAPPLTPKATCEASRSLRATASLIICAKSFRSPLSHLPAIETATVEHICRVAEKLREQDCVAGALQVFLQTNGHREQDPQYFPQATATLDEPTACTMRLAAKARQLLGGIYRDGFKFVKAGVVLLDITPASAVQPSLIGGGSRG